MIREGPASSKESALHSSSRKPLRWLLKLALSAAALVASGLVAEVSCRAWLGIRGEGYDSSETARILLERVDPLRDFVPIVGGVNPLESKGDPIRILHPYFASERRHDTGGVLGYFREGRGEGKFTVVVLGGSVAASLSLEEPGLLPDLLRNDPRRGEREIVTLNYAHAAFKQPQQLTRLAVPRSLGCRPDGGVNRGGFNGVAIAAQNGLEGSHPLCPSPQRWTFIVQDLKAMDPATLDLTTRLWLARQQTLRLVERAIDWKLYRSALLGRFTLARIERLNQLRVELYQHNEKQYPYRGTGGQLAYQALGPDYDQDEGSVIELCARAWFESSLSLSGLCQSRSIAYLHVLQPALGDPGAKLLTDREQGIQGPEGWMAGVKSGYPLLRKRGQQLSAMNVAFHDASMTFAGNAEEIFDDLCHLDQAGKRILAAAIAEQFFASFPR